MKLKLKQIINLYGGLSNLDGYDKAVGDKIVRELYQLGGPLRMLIARNLNRLQPEIDAFNDTRTSLIRQFTNGETGKVDMSKFAAGEKELLESEIEVELKMIKEEQLVLDKNPIQGTTLSAILPILEMKDG